MVMHAAPDTGSLIEASSFLIDRGFCGLVWLDPDLIVLKSVGRLVDFAKSGEPVGLAIVALYGCEDDIQDVRRGGINRFELSNIRIIDAAGEGHKLNFYVHWLETSNRYLLIVLRSTSQAELEAELENQNRQRILAEAKIREQAKQIDAANLELTRANRELSAFADIIAHDLKSPMRGMRWLAEDLDAALRKDDKDSAFQHLADLQQQARRMSRMLTDLLAYTLIGRSDETIEPTDTRSLAETIIASLPRPRDFSIELEGEWPVLETAAPMLDVVLRNLIDNAIKHHDRQNGRIVVSAVPGTNATEFTVTDDGPGIPAKYHDVVFLPFRRLESTVASATSGSGIGLSLVRKAAETAGGKLVLVSNPDQHRGTSFRLTWPGRLVAIVPAAAQPAA